MKRFQLGMGLMMVSVSLLGVAPDNTWVPLMSPSAIARETPDHQTLPPLIDRELFLADPDIAGAQLSPDGNFIAFQKQLDGVLNVWVKGIDEPIEAARPVTADAESPIIVYFWSADGRYILYVQDKGGNENFHLYAVEPGALATARNLTPVENTTALLYAVPKQTPDEIIIGLNDRDPQFHDVYRLNLTTGERSLIIQNNENIAGWTFDNGGNLRLAYRQSLAGGNELLTVENGELTTIYTCALEEICVPVQFHANNQQIYLKTNRDADLTQLELLDIETGQREFVEADPENQVDFEGAVFSGETNELIVTSYVGDRRRIYPQSDEWATDLAFLQQQLPGVDLSLNSMTRDEQLALIGTQSDVNPGAMYLYDRSARPLEKLYDSWTELQRD